MKPQLAWGLLLSNGRLADRAWRTKVEAMQWASERFIGCDEYDELGEVSPRWKLCKKRHPKMRIVRVAVRAVPDEETRRPSKMCPECKACGGPDGVTNCATCRSGFWEN